MIPYKKNLFLFWVLTYLQEIWISENESFHCQGSKGLAVGKIHMAEVKAFGPVFLRRTVVPGQECTASLAYE